jgi:predicted kinase
MRKWMSERLKRRKKAADEHAREGTKAPEPLQPRFYDDEPAPPPQKRKEIPVAEVQRAEIAEPEGTSVPAEASAIAGPKPRSRRRRGRGGRGRSRRPAVEAAPAVGVEPAVAEAPPEAPPAMESAAVAPAPAELPTKPAPGRAAQPAARASKGTVVLAIGLPGSGKSSWFKRHNIHPLSSDLLRELLFDDAMEQRFQDLVFSNLRSMLKARLIARRPMNFVDATNLTPHDRHSWIKLAKDYGYDVQGLFFDVPLEVCMQRHLRRGRVVPEEIMRKMAGKLKPPTFEEGFSKITVVRVKQKEETAG